MLAFLAATATPLKLVVVLRVAAGRRGRGGPTPSLDAVPAGDPVLGQMRLKLPDRHPRQLFLLWQPRVVRSEPWTKPNPNGTRTRRRRR